MGWSTNYKQESWSLSNTILILSPESLSIITRHRIFGWPRPHHNYFRKSSVCWWHQERRHEVLLLSVVRLLSQSGWHVWMSENLSWEPRIIFKNKDRRSHLPPFQSTFWDILLVVFALSTRQQQCVLYANNISLERKKNKFYIFIKLD